MRIKITSCGSVVDLECDRIAELDGELEALSVHCDAGKASAIKWALNNSVPMLIAGRLTLNNYQYKVYSAPCSSGVQVVALSGRPGFIACASQRSLFNHLKSRHTTPLLLEWMPEIGRAMLERGHLLRLKATGCEPALVSITTAELDDMVVSECKKNRLRWSSGD